jgi:hypothetical protein
MSIVSKPANGFRFDADPNPTFQFDVDPDPDPDPDLHQSNAYPQGDPTSSFTHVGK